MPRGKMTSKTQKTVSKNKSKSVKAVAEFAKPIEENAALKKNSVKQNTDNKTTANKKASSPKSSPKTTKKSTASKVKTSSSTAAKATVATANKKRTIKRTAKGKSNEVVIQSGDKNYTLSEITGICKNAYRGGTRKQVKSIKVYVKAENNYLKAYYVVNDGINGSVDL